MKLESIDNMNEYFPKKYKRKPVNATAIQWTGENKTDVITFFRICGVIARVNFDIPIGRWFVFDNDAIFEISNEDFVNTYEEVNDEGN